jgi:hypothetical protein
VVKVRSFETLANIHQWLATGRHPWRSVCLDSLTELQKRIIDALVGPGQMQLQDWGTLLRKMEAFVRALRDLTEASPKPVDVVLVTCMAQQRPDGSWRPLLQGQLADTLPYYFDVAGRLVAARETGQRMLLIQPIGPFVAKDATDVLTVRYGPAVEDPNVTDMIHTKVKEETE